MARIILSLVCVVILYQGNAYAAVPPEVPASRSSQIYSPFYKVFEDSGESIFQTGSVSGLGYSLGSRYIGDHAPSGGSIVGNLPLFVNMMKEPAGILFLASHGSGSGIVVEAGFSTLCIATTAAWGYVNDGYVRSDEIGISEVNGSGHVIYVNAMFFARHLTAIHDIVFADSCNSDPLWPAFTGAHVVRNYIGFDGYLVLGDTRDGFAAAHAVFDNMAGAANGGDGVYANDSIASVIPVAQNAMDYFGRLDTPTVYLEKDSILPDAGNMRLYNAPRIVMANVVQDTDSDATFETPLYTFQMGDLAYPYNPGTDYPSTGNPQSHVGGKGKIQAQLMFSEPINTGTAEFYLVGSDGTQTKIDDSNATIRWTDSSRPGATWKGTFDLPDSFPDGKTIISARAERISASGSDFYNKALDLDGDGNSALDAVDTSVDFTIGTADTTPPQITLYNAGTGATVPPSNTPETAPWVVGLSTIVFNLADSGSGLGIMVLSDDNGEMISWGFYDGAATAAVEIYLPGDKPGYLLQVGDNAGNESRLYFNVDRHAPRVEYATITIQQAGDFYSASVDVLATDEVAGISVGPVLIDLPAGQDLGIHALDSYPPGPMSTTASWEGLVGASLKYRFFAVDKADNLGANELWMTDFSEAITLTNPSYVEYPAVGDPIVHEGEEHLPGVVSGRYIRAAAFTLSYPPVPGGCSISGNPVGMSVTLSGGGYAPDARENVDSDWDNLNARLGYTPAANPSITVTETLTETDLNWRLPQYARLSITKTKNSQPMQLVCPSTTTEISPDTLAYEVSVTLSNSWTAVFAPKLIYQEWITPDFSAVIKAGAVEVGIAKVTGPGRVGISRMQYDPHIPGYRPAGDKNVYDISIGAAYEGDIKIKFEVSMAGLTETQRQGITIYHYTGSVWKKEPTAVGDGYVVYEGPTASPFVVLVPVDDTTAPHTEFAVSSQTAELDGVLYISTTAAVALSAVDMAADPADITGVATTYYLLDAEPTVECLAAPYDPLSQRGTCGNPIYAGPFVLAEGMHLLTYFSMDVAGNSETFHSKNVYADGTAPLAVLNAGGFPVGDAETAYIVKTDSVSLSVSDPEFAGAASGLGSVYFLVDVTMEACGPMGPVVSTAPAGSCQNYLYTGPFALALGAHTVYYSAADNVGNMVQIKSGNVVVAEPVQAPVIPAGAVGYWKFDEGSGGAAADSSGGGNTGTLYGVTWTGDGKVKGAANFNGALTSKVQVPGTPVLNAELDGLTLAAWIKFTAPTTVPAIIKKGYWDDGSAQPPQYSIHWRGGRHFSFEVADAGGNRLYYDAIGEGDPLVGQWAHIAATYDKARLRFFLNGQEVGPGLPAYGHNVRSSNIYLQIGGGILNGQYDGFNGAIDEVLIYHKALSIEEVLALYKYLDSGYMSPVTSATVSGTAGLSGWYSSDVNVMLSAQDRSGTGIKEIRLCVDHENACTPVSGDSITVSTEGTQYVRYQAEDNAGKIEEVKSLVVKVDKTAPTAPVVAALEAYSAFSSQSLNWAISSDTASGVAGYRVYGCAVAVATHTCVPSVMLGSTTLANYIDASDKVNYSRYFYQVTAFDNSGLESPGSNVVDVVINKNAVYQLPSTEGLAGYWVLDEGSGIIAADSSGNNNTGTLYGASWSGDGKLSGAVNFNGALTTKVRIADSGMLNAELSGLTLAAWIKVAATTSFPAIIKKGYWDDGSAQPPQYSIHWRGGRHFSFEVADAGGNRLYYDAIGEGDPLVGQWAHIAATYDKARLRFFLNGQEVGPGLPAYGHNVRSSNIYLQIGGGILNGQYDGFNGLIDEAAVYHRALSAAEVSVLYQSYSANPLAPVSTVVLTGEAGQNGWFASEVTVEIGAEDRSGTGIKEIRVCVDHENACSPVLGDSVAVSAEGVSFVRYQAEDNAGNVEAIKSKVVKVDGIHPETSLSALGAIVINGAAALISSNDRVTLVSTDTVSGVAGIRYSVDAVISSQTALAYTAPFTLAFGTHTVFYSAVDNAGNQETVKSAVFEVTLAPVPPAMGLWKFDEGSGTVAADSSGNNNDGSIFGAAWTEEGKYGPALVFDGQRTTKVQISDSVLFNMERGELSLAAWFKIAAPCVAPAIIKKGYWDDNSTLRPQFSIHWSGTRQFGFEIVDTGNNRLFYSAGEDGESLIGKWAHIVATYDKAMLRVYLNGHELGAGLPAYGLNIRSSDAVLQVGGAIINGQYDGFNGVIDEVSIFDRALSAQEVVDLYSGIISSAPVPVIAAITPHQGVVGSAFSVAGSGFGPYLPGVSQVLIGTVTSAVSSWTDTAISGSIPLTLNAGAYPVAVETEVEGELIRTSTMAFTVVTVISTGEDGLLSIDVPAEVGLAIVAVSTGTISSTSTVFSAMVEAAEAGLEFVQGAVYEIEPSGVQFETPATFRFAFNPVGIDTNTVAIYYYDSVAVAWSSASIYNQRIVYESDTLAYIEGEVYHTSVYALLRADNALQVTLDIAPDTLNLKSNGETITAYLHMDDAEGCFNLNTIYIGAINGQVLPEPIAAQLNQGKGKGKSDAVVCGTAMVKFSREAVAVVLSSDAQARITVSGELSDGSAFNAEDMIRTISPQGISRKGGGRVAHRSGAAFEAPPQSLRYDSELYLLGLEADLSGNESHKNKAAKAAGLVRHGIAYEFGPAGSVFEKPLTISLPYEAGEKNPGKLAIAYWNESGGVWELLSSRLDNSARLVKAEVSHFSQYQVVSMNLPDPGLGSDMIEAAMDSGGEPAVSADYFRLGEVYVYPDPAKGGKVPVFHVEVGTADSVKIKVFTVAGQFVHERTLAGSPQIMGQTYAYEYSWAGRIASGVYYYTIEAVRSGKKIRARGKFSVVR